jgi:hypothetical protein
MRNSALPIVSAALLVAVLLIRMESLPTAPPGSAGPELVSGIFRLTKQKRLRLASAPLEASNGIAVGGAPAAAAGEAQSFRVVVVAAEDHEPLTAALVMALAERLTENGSAVLIDTLSERPLQLPADRALCVATRTAGLPAAPGGVCEAELVVVDRLLAFPAGSPAAGAQGASGAATTTRLAITHHSRSPDGPAPAWGAWYAAIGRGMAEAVLARLAPGGLPPLLGSDGAPRADLAQRAAWPTPLPAPPFIEPLRWFGALQDDFVRGWIGEIAGLESIDEHGEHLASIARLERALSGARVVKEAAWTLDEHSSPTSRMWNREADCLLATRRADGWDVALWQQRPGIVALYRSWIDEAAAGSASARARLARYRDCAAIPADERARAPAAAPAPAGGTGK